MNQSVFDDASHDELISKVKQYRLTAFSLALVIVLQVVGWIFWASWYTFRVVATQEQVAEMRAEKLPERMVVVEAQNAEALRKLDAILSAVMKGQ